MSIRAWQQEGAVARQVNRTPAARMHPGILPALSDFAAGGHRREIAYLRAYQAVDGLVRRDGARLMRRYRRASAGVR